MNTLVVYSSTMRSLECRSRGAARPVYSLQTASRLTGVHPDLVEYYCRLGLVDGMSDQPAFGRMFEPSGLEEIRRLEHYRRNLGVQRRALLLICELWREAQRRGLRLNFLRVPEILRRYPENSAGESAEPQSELPFHRFVPPLS
jgi:DNA-binding transcriptional MerR regulator